MATMIYTNDEGSCTALKIAKDGVVIASRSYADASADSLYYLLKHYDENVSRVDLEDEQFNAL